MGKFQKLSKCLLILMLFSILLTGCGAEKEKKNTEVKGNDKIQIGICFDSFLIERWERDRDIFVSTAKELGAEVNVQNANGDLKEQIAQIEYLIDKKMDAIVIIGVEADGLSSVIKKAKDAGIIVVAYDRMIYDSNADLYISFDNEAVGRLMGEEMVSAGVKGKKVLLLGGPQTDNNVTLVNKGFSNVMSENQNEIVDIMEAINWKPEYASDYLYERPEILDTVDAIMCGNDSVATQVVRVLAEKRKAGEIIVVGQDAELEACQRIVEGTQLMTVYKPVEKQAKAAAESTIALIKGEELKEINASMSDGKYGIPAIVLEPIAVNKDNIDEVIIDSGFHLKEEVYLNVGSR